MNRTYVVVGIAVVILATVWIWSSANIRDEGGLTVEEEAATEAIVSSERIFCHDPNASPRYTIQLGACLLGAREITQEAYQAGTNDE